MEEIKGIIEIIAEDSSLIAYRPSLNKITGSVTATLLLQQVLHYWKNNDRRKFYKFKAPCGHKLYKEGQSWIETLGFTKKEFDGAMKRIGYKRGKTRKAIENENDALISYYRDSSGLTWYEPNEEKLKKELSRIYLVNDKKASSKKESKNNPPKKTEKVVYPISEISESKTESSIYHSEADSGKQSNDIPLNFEIEKLIKLFEVVNPPNWKSFFKNKTERKSLNDLIRLYGFKAVAGVIKILPETNKMQFVTVVVTPSELRRNWVKLESQVGKQFLHQNKKNSEIIIT